MINLISGEDRFFGRMSTVAKLVGDALNPQHTQRTLISKWLPSLHIEACASKWQICFVVRTVLFGCMGTVAKLVADALKFTTDTSEKCGLFLINLLA